MRETHSAVVVLFGDRAYKVKKPVDLGFLDFRTREAREAICHREVELNRRLSPDVYLGVADVHGPDGAVCDHLVVMRRMPDDRRLSALVRAGAVTEGDLRPLAHLLAGFLDRAEAPEAAAVAAGREALAQRWEDNLEVIGRAADGLLDATAVATVADLSRRYLAGRGPLFERRITEGRARDGHGDLLADDIFLLDDGPRVLDCIEFADELRYGDVLADIAFLAMDLERLGRPDLGERFLGLFRGLSGDTWPASLAHHHVAYRAGVRAKVSCLRHEQGDGGAGEQAVALLDLTRRHLEAGRVRLVLVGGLPATGKSTVAAAVGDALGAVVLRTDEIRKELAGLPTGAHAPAEVDAGIYAPEMNVQTYRALLDRAWHLLEQGESVVLDASWLEPERRQEAAALAEAAVADLGQLRCVAPLELTVARAARRTTRGTDVSDADEPVIRALAERTRPWPEAATVDTNLPIDEVVATALAAVRGGAP